MDGNGNSNTFFFSKNIQISWLDSLLLATKSKTTIIPKKKTSDLDGALRAFIMELHWDYDYYQPQTNNEQMVEKMIAIKDKKDKNNTINNILAYQDQVGLQT